MTTIVDKLPESTYTFKLTDWRLDHDLQGNPTNVAFELTMDKGPRMGERTVDETNLKTARGDVILRQKMRAIGIEVTQHDDPVTILTNGIEPHIGGQYSIRLNYRKSNRSDTIYPYYFWLGPTGETAKAVGRGSGAKPKLRKPPELDPELAALVREIECPVPQSNY